MRKKENAPIMGGSYLFLSKALSALAAAILNP
jgi:hypothetical protein